jgi:hypothetical protein
MGRNCASVILIGPLSIIVATLKSNDLPSLSLTDRLADATS